MTVLFIEHDMATVFDFATRILVLDRGRLIADAAPGAIRADAGVRRRSADEDVVKRASAC